MRAFLVSSIVEFHFGWLLLLKRVLQLNRKLRQLKSHVSSLTQYYLPLSLDTRAISIRERFKSYYNYYILESKGALFEVDRRPDSQRSRKISDKRKTVTRTFRIRAEWDDFLKQEAERRGISVNVLMNLILRRSTSFDKIARGYNVLCLTKRAFREVLEGISLDHLALAGEKTGANDIQNIIDMIGIPSNYEAFNYLVTKHFGGPDNAMWFKCYRHFHKNVDVFHLQHNLERGWSVYLKNYFLSYLKKLGIECKIRVYDYAVNIRIPRSTSSS